MMRLLIAIPIILLFAFAACKKVSGPANGNSIQPNNKIDSTVSMAALVNGIKWQTDSAFGYFIRNSGNDSGVQNLLILATKYGSNNNITTINFNIANFTGANTYQINPPLNTATYYVGNNRYYADSGQITITVNTLIVNGDTGASLTGTFSFNADTIKVINGVYNIAEP